MALDDYNGFLSVPWSDSDAPAQSTSLNAPSVRTEALEGPEQKEYQVQWDFSKTSDLQGLVSEFESVGYTRATSWTPMGSGTNANYRFTAFQTVAVQRGAYRATATLERFNGV